MKPFKRWTEACLFLASVSGDCSVLIEVTEGVVVHSHVQQLKRFTIEMGITHRLTNDE